MEKASDILETTLGKSPLSRALFLGRLSAVWPRIAGRLVALHTAPADLHEDTLTLTVNSPDWMQQLSFLKGEILIKLRENGFGDIHKIRLRLGRIHQTSSKRTYRPVRRGLDVQDESQIREWLGSVEETDLRGRLEGLLRSALLRSSRESTK